MIDWLHEFALPAVPAGCALPSLARGSAGGGRPIAALPPKGVTAPWNGQSALPSAGHTEALLFV